MSIIVKILTIIVACSVFAGTTGASEGDSLWSCTYGQDNWDIDNALIKTSDGNLVMAGWTSSYGAGSGDFWIVKIDQQGDTLWTRTIGGRRYEYCHDVVENNDGGLVLVGETSTYGYGYKDGWVVATDSLGDTLWTRTYGFAYNDGLNAIIMTSDGGFLMTGTTQRNTAGDYDIWIIKIDNAGELLWQCIPDGELNDQGNSLIETSDGFYLIAGTKQFGASNYNAFLLKMDTHGHRIWSRTYIDKEAYKIIETFDLSYLVTGLSGYPDDINVWLSKIDANGTTMWSQVYSTMIPSVARSVIETSQGYYILTGEGPAYEGVPPDILLMKTNSLGELIWRNYYGTNEAEGGNAILVDNDNYLLGGYRYYLGGYDMLLLCIEGNTQAIRNNSLVITSDYSFTSPFPNPFNPTTTIRFDLPQAARVMLEVFDTNGRCVGVQHVEPLQAGFHQIQFDGSGLPSGVYLYRLTASGSGVTPTIISGKMVLLK